MGLRDPHYLFFGSLEERAKQQLALTLSKSLRNSSTIVAGRRLSYVTGKDLMTQKFNNGDTISIEAKVAYANSDGSLNLDLPNGRKCIAFNKEHLGSAQLVKKAIPTRPAAGTVITHYSTRYIVTKDDNLTYVDDYEGETYPKYNTWSQLDHDNVKILG